MFICIGPICIPLWGVLPFILIVWKTVYKWVTGKAWDVAPEGTETEWATAVEAAAANVGEREQKEHEVHPAGDSELRKRGIGADGGSGDHAAVRSVETVKEWVDALARSKVHGTSVVVKFTATWCKPCQRIAPLFAELASATPSAEFVEVDVDKCEDVAKGAGSPFTLPTFQVYRGSVRVASMSGSSEDELKKLVASAK